MTRFFLGLVGTLFFATQVLAGTWTPNNFFYKPGVGARGEVEKAKFDSGLNRVDSRLANEKWLNDSSYGGDLGQAITIIGSTPTVLTIPSGNWSIAANLTVPANLTLKFGHGAILSITNGTTLTINGFIDAGLHQIFSASGSGKVLLGTGSVKEILPQWWGARGDNSTDCTAGIQAALDAAPVGGTIRFLDGTYLVGPLSFTKSGLKLKGSSGFGSNRTTGPTGTTRLMAKGDQTHLLEIGDTGLDYKICDVVVEDLDLHGGGHTISNAILVLKNMAGAAFHRVGLGVVAGRALYLQDFWDSTFEKCFIHDAGNAGDCTIYLAPPLPNARTINHVTFSECSFESTHGHLFESPDFDHGGSDSVDTLRIVNCKIEIGGGSSAHTSHKSVLYLPWVSRLLISGNVLTNYVTESGYDNLIEVGGWFGYSGPIICNNSISSPVSGTPSTFVYLDNNCPPAIVRNNCRDTFASGFKTFINRSTTPQAFLEACTYPMPTGLANPLVGNLWKSANILASQEDVEAFVYDADALSTQQTVCTMSQDWIRVGTDLSRDFSGYKFNIIVRARVKKGVAGTNAKCNLCFNWNESGSTWLGTKDVTSTSWTWVEWTVTASQLQSLKNLVLTTDTMVGSPTLYFDGWYYVVTNTAS